MEVKEKDVLTIELDLYANENLVQTTDEKKGKEAKLNVKEYKPQTIIIGKGFVLKAVEDDILKNKKLENTLELKPEEAYGKRQKELLRTFPDSAFKEHNTRPVVGVVYEFGNGMSGVVKSVTGGRILVDFNNPLAGKNIKVSYKVTGKVTDIKEKLHLVLSSLLRLKEDSYEIEVKEKKVTLKVPKQLVPMKDMLNKTLEEYLSDIKNYSITLVEKK